MRRALLPLALVLLALPTSSAAGDSSPGSGFDSVSLTAVAAGVSWAFGSSITPVPVEMDVPYAATQVRLGQGQATATVAWPGEAGAALGSTLIIGFGAPPQATVLNDPAYARAQSGKGPSTVSNTTVPTGKMTAHATPTETRAESSLDGASTLTTTIGAAQATSSSAVTAAARAEVTGTTTVRDVTIGGLVHISTITSSATATTDGAHASTAGTTAIAGVTVAGQGITIDEHGITIAGTGLPVGAALQAVTSALARAQITMTLSSPLSQVSGGTAEYATSALIVSTPLGVLSLGGVQLRATATPTDASPRPVTPTPGAAASAPPLSTAVPPLSAVPPPRGPAGQDPPPLTASQPLTAPQDAALAASRQVATGYGVGWVVAGLLLALAGAWCLARLPGRWLPVLKGSCPLERPL